MMECFAGRERKSPTASEKRQPFNRAAHGTKAISSNVLFSATTIVLNPSGSGYSPFFIPFYPHTPNPTPHTHTHTNTQACLGIHLPTWFVFLVTHIIRFISHLNYTYVYFHIYP